MAIFEDIELTFKNQSGTVKANKVIPLIAEIEEIVTLSELSSDNPKLMRISTAYACALNHAGIAVEVDEVYSSIFASLDDASATVEALLTLMVPPEHLRAKKKVPTKKRQKAVKKKSTSKPTS